ncbi:MAG: hypothetical protein V9G19_07270 [Tetrasphaera sp.]
MNDLTIIVTESPGLACIPAALRDWSAAGLIRPFVWVARPDAAGRALVARLIEAGDVTVSSMGDILARRSPAHVRIIALTSDLEPGADSTQAAQFVLAGVREAGGQMRTTQAQVLVTRLGVRTAALTAIVGWHNLVISPDDASGPARAHTTLEGTATDDDVARFALPAVAVIGALFDSVDAGPLDEQNPPPGASFRVLRAFARHLDGGAVREAMQAQVLGLSEGYPLVYEGGTTSATYIENIDRANLDMAAALWNRHGDVLMSARRQPQVPPIESLTLWKAFRMLWSFLWAALKNAPLDWANRVIYTGKAWAANAATKAIFGHNSAFAVVVGGVRGGDGGNWEAQVRALGDLESSLGPAGEGHQVHARLDSLWQDFVAGGLTLLDGQPRRSDMDATRIGTELGILRSGRMLAPSSVTDAFTEIPGGVRAATRTDSLAPYDALAIRRFAHALNGLAADPVAGAEASGVVERFQGWWRRVGTTYTAKVALRLSDEFEQRLAEIAENTKILQAAAATSGLPDEIRQEQGRLAKRMRLLVIVALVLVVATVVLGALSIIAWLIAAIAIAVWILGWLIGSVITFMRGQHRLFQLKNMRAQALGKADAAEYNLAAAIRDARRCGDAYRLLQLWAEALAIFAGDPLGRASAEGSDGRGPGTDHPLAIQFGRAEVNDLEVARRATQIRRQVFPVGWLDGVWGTFLASAGSLLGARGTVLLDEPQLLYRQRAIQEDTLLPMWVAALQRDGVPGVAGADLWDAIVSALQTTARPQLEALLGHVRTESGATETLTEFLGGLTGQVSHPTGFPSELFSAAAVTRDLTRPVTTWCEERAEGLSRTVVLTQSSDAMPPEDLQPQQDSPGKPRQPDQTIGSAETPIPGPRDPEPIDNRVF